MAQFATLREILALLHHWVFEVGFTRARFHPLHVDKNKTRLSMMGAVSQQLYMDRKCELSPKGTSNDSSFPWPSCHPGSRCGDLKHPNVQHGHRAAIVRAQVEEQEWAVEARMRAGKSLSFSWSCSFTTRWLQQQNHLAGSLLQPQRFSCLVLEPMAPFCPQNRFRVCSVNSITENTSIRDDIFPEAYL